MGRLWTDGALDDRGSDVDWRAQTAFMSPQQGCSGVRLHKGDECDSFSSAVLPLAAVIQNMRQSSQQTGTLSP